MSRLEDKIKRWEASVDWLKAQLEVMAGELAAAEKRAEEAEGRERNLIIDNANMSEAAASCLRRAEVLEPRLRDAEAREAVLVDVIRHIEEYWNGDRNIDALHDACGHTVEECQSVLDALPARSAAVLAVLDAAMNLRCKQQLDGPRIQEVKQCNSAECLEDQYRLCQSVRKYREV